MPYSPGDRVHCPGVGTGVVRDARGGGRYVVEIKGRMVVVAENALEPAIERTRRTGPHPAHPAHLAHRPAPERTRRTRRTWRTGSHLSAPGAPGAPDAPGVPGVPGVPGAPDTLDLHGLTVEQCLAEVAEFVNRALLAGHAHVHVIHGRGGGRLKSAVHAYLRGLPGVSFRLDPRNPGVTIVTFA